MDYISYSRYRRYYQNLGPIWKKPHVRAYTTAALSFFLLSFFGAFAIRPSVKQIFELNRKIADRRLVNQKLDGKLKNLQLAEKEYDKIRSDLPLILAALPQKPNFPPVLKSLEKNASASGITWDNLKFSDIDLTEKKATSSAATAIPLESFAFNLGVTSSYLNSFSFLKGLQTQERLLSIGKFNLQSAKSISISAELNLDLEANAYFSRNKITSNEQ